MEDKVIGYIYETRDYSKFKRMVGNRSVSHSNRIKKSCEKSGQLMSPILVNEKYEIIDGQNRFEAWKECGFPIRYIVAENYSVDECVALNRDAKNWRIIDYVDSFAERGNPNYIALKNLEDKYKNKIPVTFIRSIAKNNIGAGNGGQQADPVVNGNFQFRIDPDKAEQILSYIMAFEFPKQLWGSRAKFMSVIAFCFFSAEVDNDKLLRQWNNRFDLVHGITNVRAAAEAVELVYNYGCKKSCYTFIASMYRAEMMNRSFAPGGGKSNWE